jgi:hypothetical protein
MKNILTILITLLVGNVFCQSDEWRQLPSPDKTFMDKMYMTRNGNLFGLDFYSRKIQYKHKLKNKWEDVRLLNIYKGNLNEDKEGNLYFSDDVSIYRFDEDSLKAKKYFNLTGSLFYFDKLGGFVIHSLSFFQ